MPNYGIFHEGLTSVDANLLRVLQRDALTNRSDLCMVLDSMALNITGPAGSALAITDARGLPKGVHYTGFDAAGNYDIAKPPVKHFEDWSSYAVPVAISGTELSENSGSTTRELINTYETRGSIDAADAFVYYDLLGKRYEDAADNHAQAGSLDLWGHPFPADDIEGVERNLRRPATLNDIFDLDASVHGLMIDGLGEWNDLHPWRDGNSPGDGLADEQKKYVHCPRIYRPAAQSQPSKALLEQPLHDMSGVGGEFLAGINPILAGPLFREFDDNDQGPVLVGYDQWRLEIQTVRYQNCIFFRDDHAPTDRIRMIHIGTRAGNRRRNPGFQIVNWMPKSMMQEYRRISAHQNELRRNDPKGVRMGDAGMIPFWNDEFARLHAFEDAIGTKIRRQWAQMCYHRWKHIEIQNLRG